MPDIFTTKNTKQNEDSAETTREANNDVSLPHAALPPVKATPPKTWSDEHKDRITLMNEPPHTPGIFSAFSPRPIGLTFEDQEPNEEILLLLRRHFLTNVPWITFSLVLLLLPLFTLPFLSEFFTFLPASFFSFFSGITLFTILAFYYLIVAGFILNQFVTWFYQVGIVTNIRIVDVDFNTLLSRNIAYTDLTDIVDTEAHQRGLLQGIFSFGSVGVQTAGMKANFEFTNVPQPNKVVDILSDLMRDKKDHGRF
jgi:hypothetical protein